MSAEVVRFFILGKIPGTDARYTFRMLACVLALLAILYVNRQLYKTAKRFRGTIDPYYGAPKELSLIDLLSI